MIPWIQVYSNLPQHRKTSRLAEELKLSSAAVDPNMVAVGILIGLWTWAIQNAYDGDLSECSARTIANACQWKKKPETLVAALQKTGWLDADMRLHDWEEYAVLLIDQEESRKQKTRERVSRYRNKKSAAGNVTQSVTGNVTDTPCNAPTVPNQTIPDHLFSGGDGDAGARAQEALSSFLSERSTDTSLYFGSTPEIQEEVAAFTSAAFSRFADRRATENDEAQAFLALYSSEQDPQTGDWRMTIPPERKDLLLYAFEAASNAGKPGDWRYIQGVLANLSRRGILTLADAEDYDDDRFSKSAGW